MISCTDTPPYTGIIIFLKLHLALRPGGDLFLHARNGAAHLLHLLVHLLPNLKSKTDSVHAHIQLSQQMQNNTRSLPTNPRRTFAQVEPVYMSYELTYE